MEKVIADEELEETQKCLKKRQVKHCTQCCRFLECWGDKKLAFSGDSAEKLAGAIILSALIDSEIEIPPLSECKNKDQKAKRNQLMHRKATAQNFFKSKLFQYCNINLEYLRETYGKIEIQEERY